LIAFLEPACYAVAMPVSGWAVWVRRHTFRMPYEQATTLTIVLIATAAILLSPASTPVFGRLGWELTGRWHLDDFVGHLMLVAAIMASNSAGMMRLPSVRRYMVPLLWHPLVIGSAVMAMLFAHSRASHSPAHDLLSEPPGPWLSVYLAVFVGLIIYGNIINAGLGLVHLRGDQRARPVALVWMGCAGLGTIALLVLLLPALHITACWYSWCRVAMCVALAVFSVASARSWQRKLDPYRRLIEGTRT